MKVLMVGCDRSTKGGMWKVVENYIESDYFMKETNLEYIPTSVTGNFGKKIIFTFKAYLKVLHNFVTKKPDILHIHMSERGSVFRKGLIISLAYLLNIKIIIHMHGAEFEIWYKSQNTIIKKIVRHIIEKADKVIILGQYWYEFIRTLCPENKIFVLHNAVYVPKENKYNIEAKNILFLGVVGKRKGAYDLLDSFKECLSDIPYDINLLYYGPDFESEIRYEIKKRQLDNRVKYMGWLSEKERNAVFENTMMNVLPSYNEGLPMTILETMAYGIPNISTKVAAIPEVINANNGMLVEPGKINQLSNVIKKLSNSSEIRASKSENAYLTIKNDFSIETHVKKLIGLYKSILQ